jgi:hypothetical protein
MRVIQFVEMCSFLDGFLFAEASAAAYDLACQKDSFATHTLNDCRSCTAKHFLDIENAIDESSLVLLKLSMLTSA